MKSFPWNNLVARIHSVLPILCLLVLGVFLSGCAAVVVGGATGVGVAYSMGSLESAESGSLDRAYAAAQGALKDLEFTPSRTTKDGVEARVEGETAAGKSITIRLKRITDQATEVKIRVGTFGDESVSRLLLEKLRARL